MKYCKCSTARTALVAIVLGLQLAALDAVAQTAWPNRPLRFIIPSTAGGPTDVIGRILAEGIQKELNQTVIIDNRPGAGGKIGLRAVAQAQPDGYTFVIGNPGPVAVVGHTETNVGYDVVKDFEPVSMLMRVPVRLVVRSELPVRNVAELAALMKRDPKAVAFGSSGEGQSPHMAAQLLQNMTGVNFLIVPYKGAPPAVNDLLGGSIQAMFDTTTTLPHVQTGRLRSLAIGSASRSPLMPQLPTMAEAGFPGFEISSWYVLLAPAKTPQAIIDRLNRVVRNTLESTESRAQLARLNADGIPSTPAETRNYIIAEVENWGNIVKRISAGKVAAPK